MKHLINYALFPAMMWGMLFVSHNSYAQSRLYPEHFDLQEVTLQDGPFKQAMDINIDELLSYDVDRLLTPFVRQAGLTKTQDTESPYYRWEECHPNFVNWCWNPSFALDGHVGGHYISALAMAHAASRDEVKKAEIKRRLDHMITVLADCQAAYSDNNEGLQGFIGGLPDNEIWTRLYQGDASVYKKRGGWVPFYCIHKVMAGLRDAWLYMGDEQALRLFRGTCDWSISLVSRFDRQAMERDILSREHGGINEVLADAYAIFGDEKYLEAARKYSHQHMIDGMQQKDDSRSRFLDNRHANTQVPKYIGFERVNQLSHEGRYQTAVHNFWNDVVRYRTVAIGGNSVSEHFMPSEKSRRYIQHTEGPESCNTNNMMKLTECLFEDTHDAAYVDFYEQAMLNHILSTQDPETGGYVYFTSLRPESYRIYSTPNCAMWCCVGTGMENHSKYGHFIYTHASDTLYVNLFVASELNDETYALRQETAFPYGENSRITLMRGGRFTLSLRHPSWATEDFKVKVNGKPVECRVNSGEASFVSLTRKWKKGDVIEVDYPMSLSYVPCPDLPDYVAFKYGPVLLAAATTSPDHSHACHEELPNVYAGDGRMDHSPSCRATFKNLAEAPMLLGDRDKLLERVSLKDRASLRFNILAELPNSATKGVAMEHKTLELQPFYGIHHARYVVYWLRQTPEEWAANPLAKQEAELAALEARTLDKVAPGEQQSEAGHAFSGKGGTWVGVYNGELYRTNNRGASFAYTLSLGETEPEQSLSLFFRLSANDLGRRFRLMIDGIEVPEPVVPTDPALATIDGFIDLLYPIPAEVLKRDGGLKSTITVQFSPAEHSGFPGIYYLRLLKD